LGIGVIAIDGKTVKGSYERETAIAGTASGQCLGNRTASVLAQTKVQDKSNEITAIPALLELLDIAGCVVRCHGHPKPLLNKFMLPKQIIFSVSKPTIPSCFKT